MVSRVLDFHSVVDEVPALLGSKAVSDSIWLPKFRYNTVGDFENSMTKYPVTQFTRPEERPPKRLTNDSPTIGMS